jgi:hypothetical protein
MIKPVATCRLPQVCAQLGLPADQIMSDKGPHLLLCAALLAAPSAATWLFHAAATAAGHSMADRTAAARKGPAGVLTGAGSGADMAEEDSDGLSSLGQVSFLRMSYSVLPLVWAGACVAGAAILLQCKACLMIVCKRFLIQYCLWSPQWAVAVAVVDKHGACVFVKLCGRSLNIQTAILPSLPMHAIDVKTGTTRLVSSS